VLVFTFFSHDFLLSLSTPLSFAHNHASEQLLALVKNFRDERRQGVPADVVDKFQALVDSADIVLTLDGVSNKAEKPPLFPVEGMDSDIEEALAKCRIALPAPLLSRSTFAFLHVSV